METINFFEFEEIDEIDEIDENSDIFKIPKSLKNIFPYHFGSPTDKLTSLDKYYEFIINDYISFRKTLDIDGPYIKNHIDPLKYLLTKIISNKIKYVYVEIYFPFKEKTTLKFKCYKQITYGMLLYLNTVAYQIVSEIKKEELTTNVFSRNSHHIKKYIYNGHSDIEIYDNYITCQYFGTSCKWI